MINVSDDVSNQLQAFIQFHCEGKVIAPQIVIDSTIHLLFKCQPARQAILHFYRDLIDGIVFEYCNPAAVNSKDTLVSRLFRSTPEVVPELLRRISVESNHENHSESVTPQSPPSASQVDKEEQPPVNITGQVETFVQQVGDALLRFISENEANQDQIVEWALATITQLSTKYANYAIASKPASNPVSAISTTIKFWLDCPIVRLLLAVILGKSSVTGTDSRFKKIIEYSPNSDWICAYIMTSLPSTSVPAIFSSCIESLLNSKASPSSITSILSYLSEYNPRAIINCSKSNVPFLLKLCSNSSQLLKLLADEAAKQVNISMLNEMSKTLNEDLSEHILFCILNAPNAYNLLVLVFEACIDKEANSKVSTHALRLLNSVVSKIHEAVYSASFVGNLPILDILKSNVDLLIVDCVNRANTNLRKFQLKILQLLCIHYGLGFTAKVISKTLDSLNINYESYTTSHVAHPLLLGLVKSLKLPFGADVQLCFKNAVKEPSARTPKFWANLASIYESDESVEMDIELLTLKFIEIVSQNSCLFRIYYSLRLIQSCMEKTQKAGCKPNHHLCIALVDNYIKLLDSLDVEDTDEELKFHIITASQKCMSFLATGQTANQHILCRALIESELNGSEYINREDFGEVDVSLLQNNLSLGNSLKFRKIPLNPTRRDVFQKANDNRKPSIRRQLLYDAVRCCVVDVPSFASLLVECVTPDVMFNDLPWPDEDFLKVTIERDLHIARKFDNNPILWDLCGYIAKDSCLHYCSVLIRALMAVQLTQWASATATKEKLGSTQKLVSLIASSELVPDIPFQYLPDVLPSLTAWEIFCVLNDLWRYMKENSSVVPNVRHTPTRPFLERLRIILSQKLPGPLYVKIFKGIK